MSSTTRNSFASSSLPGEDEPTDHSSRLPDMSHVTVNTLPERVQITFEDGQIRDGFVSYTEGLAPTTLEFELLAFSEEQCGELNEDCHGLRSTAMMLSLGVPHLVPVGLSDHVHSQLQEAGVPATARVQVLVDETSLDTDRPSTVENAKWLPDGGLALMCDQHQAVAVQQFFQQLEEQQIQVVDQLVTQQRELLKKYDWTCVGVFDPAGQDTPFVYTAGLSLKERPELLISGLFDVQDLAHLANQVATHVMTPEAQVNGRLVTKVFDSALKVDMDGVETPIGVRLREVEAQALMVQFLRQVETIVDAPVTRVALVEFSDNAGRFPQDEGFINFFGQPEEMIATLSLP